MTFDDHLQAAWAKMPASMHELASLFAIAKIEKAELQAALMLIARGRTDCGRPLGGETARAIARASLTKLEVSW